MSAWRTVPLCDVVESVEKVEPARTGRPSFRYIDIGSVDGSRHRIVDAAHVPSDGAPGRARQLVRAGDTVFSTVRPYLEKIARVEETLDGEIASTGFCVLRPSRGILHPTYLFHYMTSQALLDQVLPMQRGVSYPAVRDRDVLSATIPLPPFGVQQQIAEILEDHLSRLDAGDDYLAAAAARSMTAIRSSAAAAVQAAERDATTPVVQLAELARIGSGTTPRRGVERYWHGGTVPWVTSGELAQGVVAETSERVTEAAIAETALRLWPSGTLLVAMYGEGKTRGTVGELAIPATTNQACAAIQLHDNDATSRAWMRLVLGARYESMRRSSSGGVQPNLTLGFFKSMTLPWPSKATMMRLIASHEELTQRTAQASQAIAKAQGRSRALRRALLAAAFSGRLTNRSSDLDLAEGMAPT